MKNQNPQDATSEFENIQRLLRLKRYEQPGEGFTEQFLKEFHHRQRAEMLQQSSLQLFWERATTWWENLLVPKWGLAVGAAAICLMSVWVFSGGKSAPEMTAVPVPVPVIPDKPFIPKMDLSELPMANMADRNNKDHEDSLIRKHLQISPSLEAKVQALPASAKGLQNPDSQKVVPAGQAEVNEATPGK